MDKSKILVFDVETTGLNNSCDEILQLSLIDGNYNVLFNEYFKPTHTHEWSEAASINGITSDMVADKKTFDEFKDTIQSIFDNAEHYVAYNIWFDWGFLEAHGIIFNYDAKRTDVMLDFAEIYGEWNDYFHDWKWQKLITCANYYGYTSEDNFHNSFEDVKATLYCYYKMRESCENK